MFVLISTCIHVRIYLFGSIGPIYRLSCCLFPTEVFSLTLCTYLYLCEDDKEYRQIMLLDVRVYYVI